MEKAACVGRNLRDALDRLIGRGYLCSSTRPTSKLVCAAVVMGFLWWAWGPLVEGSISETSESRSAQRPGWRSGGGIHENRSAAWSARNGGGVLVTYRAGSLQ